MGIFRYDNPLMVFLVRVANMMIVSFFWVLCCIPVVTVLPASAALFHCVDRVVMAGGSGVARDFFRSFKAALKPGILLTVLTEIVGALIWFGIRTGTMIWDTGILGTIYMALGVLIVIICSSMLVYIPPVLSRFEGGSSVILRLAMYFSGKSIMVSIWYVALLVMAVWFVDFFPPVLFVIPALYTDLTRRGINKRMNRYIEQIGLSETEAPEETKPPEDDTPTALELESLLTEDENG